MSLINQVLNDLERRGTAAVAGADAVRAVPPPANRLIVLITIAVVLAAVLAGMLWKTRYRTPVPVPVPAPVKPVVAIPQPASQPQPAVVVADARSKESVAPVTRHSSELSSIPLPASEPSPAREEKAVERHVRVPAKKSKVPPLAVEAPAEYGGQPVKRVSPQQQATDEFGQALALIQQGRKSEALPHLETMLQLDPGHVEARRMLVGLLLEGKRNAEAERALQDGLRHDPQQPALAMLLARLQVERGALAPALETLEKTLPFADQQANYHAFVAAVLQRQNRHQEAITHYQIALHLSPNSAVWWMGLGISLQAVDRDEDARNAFRRAAGLHQLNAELQAFVEKRLEALTPPAK